MTWWLWLIVAAGIAVLQLFVLMSICRAAAVEERFQEVALARARARSDG